MTPPLADAHPVVYHPDFALSPLPDAHRFPMPKDHLLYLTLTELGLARRTFTPTLPDLDTLALAHDRSYLDAFTNGTLPPQAMKQIGLPWSPALVQRTLIGTGSAVTAARLAINYGAAVMCNGGTHHAHHAHGSGWCILNDQAVAARAVQRDVGIQRILFVDLDVHLGDGTATIFAADNDVRVFSMHCAAQSFPERVPCDYSIELPAGTTDELYMETLQRELPRVLDDFQPELVMYNAGVDVHATDNLGKMALSTRGILRRDRFVFAECLAKRQIPVAAAIGGGYAANHDLLVKRHVMVHLAAREVVCGVDMSDVAERIIQEERVIMER